MFSGWWLIQKHDLSPGKCGICVVECYDTKSKEDLHAIITDSSIGIVDLCRSLNL